MELRFILTASCNFSCYFCLNEYFPAKRSPISITAEDYGFVVNVGQQMGISNVTLTGGEPLIRQDFPKVVAVIRSQCPECHITVVTNGSLLHKRIEALAMVDELHVSLHTFDDNEWARITGKRGYKSIVETNIRKVRQAFPSLPIKLNVVSEQANNSASSIQKYIEFARELNLQINVFKEGYLKIAKMLGMDVDYVEPAPLWDLSPFHPLLVRKAPRKEVYMINGVRIILSMTSTDEISWDAIWITPTGVAYCNALHTTPAIKLLSAIKSRDRHKLVTYLDSLIEEARLSRILAHGGDNKVQAELNKVIEFRRKNYPAIDMKNVYIRGSSC